MSWKNQKSNLFEPVPAGNYPVALEEYKLTTTKPEKGSKLMFEVSLKVAENDCDELQVYVGRVFRDWMVVGIDADPAAEEVETLNSGTNGGCAKIKRIAEAIDVEPDDPEADITMEMLDEILSSATGNEFVIHMKKKDDMNNINGYFKTGERQLGLDTMAGKGSKGKGSGIAAPSKNIHDMKKAALAQKAKATAAPVDDDEDEAPAPKKGLVVKKGTVKTLEAHADDDDDAPVVKKGKAPKAIDCPLECGTKVPYADLAKHVEKCTGPTEQGVTDDED